MSVQSLSRSEVGAACSRPRCAAVAAAAVLAALALAEARADVFKCAGEGGRPIYQEMPCPPGKELRNFQSDPPEITVLPGMAKGDGRAPPASCRTARAKTRSGTRHPPRKP